MKIISGGQTGADQAGWRAAKAYGIETGGWMPARFMTEDGPRPDFSLYGARVWVGDSFTSSSETYRDRTWRNVAEANLTLWFTMGGEIDSPGFYCTKSACKELNKRLLVVNTQPAWLLADTLSDYWPDGTINVAGSRESRSPGIGAWVEKLLGDALAEVVKGE